MRQHGIICSMKNPLVSAIVLSYGGKRARETVACVKALLDNDFLVVWKFL